MNIKVQGSDVPQKSLNCEQLNLQFPLSLIQKTDQKSKDLGFEKNLQLKNRLCGGNTTFSQPLLKVTEYFVNFLCLN